MSFNHIFISYQHESNEHAAAVRKLADRLIAAGLSVELDQIYLENNPGGPDEGWPKWCADRAEKSNCVLIVPSVGWFAAFDGTAPPREGHGAATEAHLFRQWLYDKKQVNERLRLTFVDSLTSDKVPLPLKAWHQFRPVEQESDFKRLVAWAGKTALATRGTEATDSNRSQSTIVLDRDEATTKKQSYRFPKAYTLTPLAVMLVVALLLLLYISGKYATGITAQDASQRAIQELPAGRTITQDLNAPNDLKPESPLERARQALKSGNYSVAIEIYEASLSASSEMRQIAGIAYLELYWESPQAAMLDKAQDCFETLLNGSDRKNDPKAWAEYVQAVALIFYYKGNYSKSAELDENALDVIRLEFGDESTEASQAMSNLAESLQAAGNRKESIGLLRKSLEIDKRAYGEASPIVAGRLRNLAEALIAFKQFDEALALLNSSDSIYKQHNRTTSLEYAMIKLNHAEILINNESYIAAHNELFIAMSIIRNGNNARSPLLADCIESQGKISQLTMNRRAASLQLLDVIDILEVSLGKNHPGLGVSLVNLALTLENTSQDLATVICIRAYKLIKTLPNTLYTAEMLNTLSSQFRSMGQIVLARLVALEAIRRLDSMRSHDVIELASATNNLALTFLETKNYMEAISLFHRSILTAENCKDEESSQAIFLDNLAVALVDLGAYDAAEPVRLRAISLLRRSKTKSAYLALCIANLGVLYSRLGRTDLGETFLLQAVGTEETNEDCYSVDQLTHLLNLADLKLRSNENTDIADHIVRVIVQSLNTMSNQNNISKEFKAVSIAQLEMLLLEHGRNEQEIQSLLTLDEGIATSTITVRQLIEQGILSTGDFDAELDSVVFACLSKSEFNRLILDVESKCSPHLEFGHAVSRRSLLSQAFLAFQANRNAEALVLYDAGLQPNEREQLSEVEGYASRITRAAALRELGSTDDALRDLRNLRDELNQIELSAPYLKGDCLYQIALCELYQGNRQIARNTITLAIESYGTADDQETLSRRNDAKQLAENITMSPPKQMEKKALEFAIDTERLLLNRRRESCERFAKEPDQRPEDLLRDIYGNTESTDDVLSELEKSLGRKMRIYRELLDSNNRVSPILHESIKSVQ